MKKKGFTLIELLAVIVILAVIALIATPAVLNVIEDSKKAAAETSARNIVSSAETYYLKELMNNNKVSSIDLSTDTLKYDGDKAEKGYVNFDKEGKGSGKMYISGYCVTVTSKSEITSEKVDADDCEVTIPQVIYLNGEVIYYNPETNTKCTEAEANTNTAKNKGCMKWHAFNDEGGNKINLLLDHNTTEIIAWAAIGADASGPKEVKKQLQTDTSSWNTSINARLIEASEIAKITGNTTWTSDSNYYYLHDNTQIQYTGAAGTNKYAWLFDNTYTCTTYGCNKADSNNYGYWTGTPSPSDTDYVWFVYFGGVVDLETVDITGDPGVRPVITVSKDVLK